MPRKNAISDPSVSDQLWDQLGRFTEPAKRQKKVQRTQIRKKTKEKQVCERHKKYANQFYNVALNKETYEHLLSFVTQPFLVNKGDLEHKLQTQTEPAFEEATVVDCNNPMAVVGHFIKCADFCQTWLIQQLAMIGWKANMTNYHPLSVSHSTTELTKATLECFRMACKQMILVLEYK
jgi:hypothetical protein